MYDKRLKFRFFWRSVADANILLLTELIFCRNGGT